MQVDYGHSSDRLVWLCGSNEFGELPVEDRRFDWFTDHALNTLGVICDVEITRRKKPRDDENKNDENDRHISRSKTK